MNYITMDDFLAWRDQHILHGEDEWDGMYKTYGEMWEGEGYMIDRTKSLNEVYQNEELFYYCNACGDINIPGTDPWGFHDVDELPRSARELYENYWMEGAGLCMYVVEYKCEKAMAVTALFDYGYREDLLAEGISLTDEEFFAAMKNVAIMYRNAFRYETLVGKDTDPDGHEIVFIVPASACDTVRDFTGFVGDRIYKDFEDECRNIMKKKEG